jgi:hypothetical protein
MPLVYEVGTNNARKVSVGTQLFTLTAMVWLKNSFYC